MKQPTHLGDGAYASTDGYSVWLTANHHELDQATDKVCLDWRAMEALCRWYFEADVWDKMKGAAIDAGGWPPRN